MFLLWRNFHYWRHWRLLYPRKTKLLYIGFTPSDCLSDHYQKRVCRAQWPLPWPISPRSYSHDFVIKLHIIAMPALQHLQFWLDCFLIWHKWSLAWERVSHAMTFNFWPMSSRSFNCDFAMKPLEYVTTCSVRSRVHIVVGELFPFWHKWSLARNDLWPWTISSRLFSCDMLISPNTAYDGTMCHLQGQ